MKLRREFVNVKVVKRFKVQTRIQEYGNIFHVEYLGEDIILLNYHIRILNTFSTIFKLLCQLCLLIKLLDGSNMKPPQNHSSLSKYTLRDDRINSMA